MKIRTAITCMMLLFCAAGLAQERDRPRANYFLFAAPGQRHDTGRMTLEIGGGAEGYVYKGLGIGFDAGGMHIAGIKNWGSVLTLRGVYNFNPQDTSRLSPFVTAGCSLMVNSDVPGGYNFGGGLQYWFFQGIALRLEIRDHVFTGYRNHHYPQGLIGIVFRR